MPPPADASDENVGDAFVFPSSDVDIPPADAEPPWDHLVANLAPPPPDDDGEAGS